MAPRPKSKGCRRGAGKRAPKSVAAAAGAGGRGGRRVAGRDPSSLLEEAGALAAVGDLSASLSLTEAALKADGGRSASVQEAAGVQLLELGQPELGRQCLLRSAALSPDAGHLKFVYLSQLHAGREALQFLDCGIAALTAETPPSSSASSSSDAAAEKSKAVDLASAWCARCELFMTDLCDEPGAEASCEEAIANALLAAPDRAEALQLRCGLRLVQGRRQEALDDIRRSLDVWLPALRDGRLDDADDSGLTCQQRLRAAELLLELGDTEAAIDVLDVVVEEDDELPQAWLLFGLAYQRIGGDAQAPAARFHLRRAAQLLRAAADDPGADAESRGNAAQQVEQVEEMLRQLPAAAAGDGEERQLEEEEEEEDGAEVDDEEEDSDSEDGADGVEAT